MVSLTNNYQAFNVSCTVAKNSWVEQTATKKKRQHFKRVGEKLQGTLARESLDTPYSSASETLETLGEPGHTLQLRVLFCNCRDLKYPLHGSLCQAGITIAVCCCQS